MSRTGEGQRRVEDEIRAEKAAALGRAAYRAARERARTARLHLLIQREAVGLRNHRVVDQQFPEPAPPPWL
jgi:hypothetical protein